MHMRIVQGPELIVDLPEWDGPVPRVGEYIFHPPYGKVTGDDRARQVTEVDGGIAGCVRSVTWRTHDRSAMGFVMTKHPYVEISI